MGQQFLELKKHLPNLGVGLGFRREIADNIFDLAASQPRKIDWLEFAPENYMGIGGKAAENLARAGANFPLVSHGVNLSIGSTDDLNIEYIENLGVLLDKVNSPWWSDHLCFTSVNGIYMHDLLPLPLSREAVDHVVRKIKTVQSVIERPFLLENISYYMNMPGDELTEVQFISEVLEKADCGLLLDVNNLYVNTTNRGYDAKEFLNQLPLERTVQIHIAGHEHNGELIIDTHGEAVIEPVYQLLEYVLPKTGVKAILLERDQNFPEFHELLAELDRISEIAGNVDPAFSRPPNCTSTPHTATANREALLPA